METFSRIMILLRLFVILFGLFAISIGKENFEDPQSVAVVTIFIWMGLNLIEKFVKK